MFQSFVRTQNSYLKIASRAIYIYNMNRNQHWVNAITEQQQIVATSTVLLPTSTNQTKAKSTTYLLNIQGRSCSCLSKKKMDYPKKEHRLKIFRGKNEQQMICCHSCLTHLPSIELNITYVSAKFNNNLKQYKKKNLQKLQKHHGQRFIHF